jgi:hypothetical protein
MSEWSEGALKKKNYRRGGLEPDPPRVRKKKDKTVRIFKVEKRWDICGLEWWGINSYLTLEMAICRVKEMIRKDWVTSEKRYRIVNKVTKEVLWEMGIDDGDKLV